MGRDPRLPLPSRPPPLAGSEFANTDVGQGGPCGAPGSEETFATADKGLGAERGVRVLPGLSGGPLMASPFPVTIGQWQPLGQALRPEKHPPETWD